MKSKAKKINNIDIPKEVRAVLVSLNMAGFEAFAVGGCVRDLLREEKPKDWDVTTAAKPNEIQKIFPESFYENNFLTVTVKTGSENYSLSEIEITTYRAEGKYTDKRHPDEVRFAKTLDQDLSRRDFTMNAIAIGFNKNGELEIHDPFYGKSDIDEKIIKAVGDPKKRLEEDALRMMRAIRFSSQLGFEIDKKTRQAISEESQGLQMIAKERIRDELVKIIDSEKAKDGIETLENLGLLKFIIPELREGIGAENRPRVYTIFEHNLRALDYGVQANFSTEVRIAALLHDVGKPRTRGEMKRGEWTFYGHDIVGSKMSVEILERLHFSRHIVEKIARLVRWHLFKYDSEEATRDSSIRRLIRRVGAENIDDLVKLRMCDRMGMGVPKALPYRLRHFQYRAEKVLREEESPSPRMLALNGSDVMAIIGISPGPKVGHILEVLLQEVIDNPSKNSKDKMEERVRELGKLSDEKLITIAEKADSKIEMVENERISKIKAKYWVK